MAVVLPALSHATASGRNGEIAFSARVHTISQVFTVRPDGTATDGVRFRKPQVEHIARLLGEPAEIGSSAAASMSPPEVGVVEGRVALGLQEAPAFSGPGWRYPALRPP